jgi:hypothetical protein
MEEQFIGEHTESGLSPRHELDLKIVKIGSLVDNIQKRIAVHEGRLAKLYHQEEQSTTKDRITRLTQRILERS